MEDAMTVSGTFTVEQISEEYSGTKYDRIPATILKKIGAADALVLLKKLRSSEHHLSERIGYAKDRQETLRLLLKPDFVNARDASVDPINLQAPVFGDKVDSILIGSWYVKHGNTTFRFCGHCEYASWWSGGKVGCQLNPSRMEDEGSLFDAPCKIRPMLMRETQNRIAEFEKAIDMRKMQRDIVRENIRLVQQCIPEAPRIPLAYSDRNFQHFAYGDRVWVYLFSPIFGKSVNHWTPATVIAAGRDFDKIKVALDRPLVKKADVRYSGTPPAWRARAWEIYRNTPFILHAWEFAYFANADSTHVPVDECIGEWTYGWPLYDRFSGTSIDPDRVAFLASFRGVHKHIAGVAPGKRLMSVDEALRVLEITAVPKNVEDLLKVYRGREFFGTAKNRRAKDTLLIRIIGTTSTAD